MVEGGKEFPNTFSPFSYGVFNPPSTIA